MRDPPLTKVQLLSFDKRLDTLRTVIPLMKRPPNGWVRTIRAALGMTMLQLARRASITQPSVAQIEKSEISSRVQIDTLIRVAEALECDLVYALVPRRRLSTMVEARRTKIAEQRYARSSHSMALENQLDPTSQEMRAAKIDAIRKRIRPSELWELNESTG